MRQPVRIVAHRNRNGSLSIRLRVTTPDAQVDIATGVTVEASHWDKRRQRIAPTHPDARSLNDRINTIADQLRTLLANTPTATPQQLRDAIQQPQADTPCNSDDFFDVYDLFVRSESRRNNWSRGTRSNYDSLRSVLVRYNPLLRLSTLDAQTLDTFIASRVALGRNNTSIARTLRRLLTFLRWASIQGYYAGTLHTTYRPRLTGSHFETKQIIYLTTEELQRVETIPLPAYLAFSRDIFVFCCYTGLRISDAQRLRNLDISDGCIHIVTRKTADSLRIELNKHSAAIVRKYLRENSPAEPLFSVTYTTKAINNHLRAIGQLCAINTSIHLTRYSGAQRIDEILPKWQLLTSHVARRTFVVNALRLGIPAEVITRWTGHSSLNALRPYVAIVDAIKAESMARFDDL